MHLRQREPKVVRKVGDMIPPQEEGPSLAFDCEKDVTFEQKERLFHAVLSELSEGNIRRATTYAGRLALIYPERLRDLQSMVSLDQVQAGWALQLQEDQARANGKIDDRLDTYSSGTFDLWLLHESTELYPGFIEQPDIQKYLGWSLQITKKRGYGNLLNLAVLLSAEQRTFLDDQFWEQALKEINRKIQTASNWCDVLTELARLKVHRPALLSAINWGRSRFKWDPSIAKRIVTEEFDHQASLNPGGPTFAFPLMPMNILRDTKILVWPEVAVDPNGGRILFSPLSKIRNNPLPQRSLVE